MRRHLVTPQNGKAWLFHRSRWIAINDPLSGEELPIFLASGPRRQNLRRHFYGYKLTQWTLGPTFLRPAYGGSLVYVYMHEEEIKARFLILIEADHTSEILYAQDLPDAIELLHWLAPIIETDILVDIYRRGIATFSRK
jgi:hypothetical protein